jgi:hypothetical protein
MKLAERGRKCHTRKSAHRELDMSFGASLYLIDDSSCMIGLSIEIEFI